MIQDFEHAMLNLRSASEALYLAAQRESACLLDEDQVLALTGALLHFTFVTGRMAQVEMN